MVGKEIGDRFGELLRRSFWTLPLAGLAAIVLMGINEAAFQRSSSALEDLGRRTVVRAQIQAVWRGLLDAETGQRGFLLTGRAEYLEPYLNGIEQVRAAVGGLASAYGGDVEAAPLASALLASSAQKMSELSTTLDLRRLGRDEAWRELLLTDFGRERMERVRDAAQRLLELETARTETRRDRVLATLNASRLGVHAMTLLALVALGLFLRQLRAFDAAQQAHREALKGERDELEVEVARRTGDLTELARHLHSAREDERSRVARELHDELGALLTAAKLDATRLKRALANLGEGAAPAEVQSRLQHLNESIQRGIELKRRIIEDLRPSALSNLGLTAAIGIMAREHAKRSGQEVSAELDEGIELEDGAEITAYRLVQEALTNIAKHARARRITIMLKRAHGTPGGAGGERVRVAVLDDGQGFDTARRPGSTHGLMGMRYRVEAEGGEFRVRSAPGQGTLIEAWLPALPARSDDQPATADPAIPTA